MTRMEMPLRGDIHDQGDRIMPWGAHEDLLAARRFRVRHLVIRPGAALPMQAHYHRAEHFIVVEGAGRIRLEDREIFLEENATVFVPLGKPYAIENHGKVPLQLIEVRTGSYTGDDDVMPLETEEALAS